MPCRYAERTACRICESTDLYRFLDLGSVPPANAFVESPDAAEPSFPLEVQFCRACTHVQLRYTVDR